MKHRKLMMDLAERKAAVDRVAKNSGIYEYLYNDFTAEMNKYANHEPEWSLTELFPLTYPDETSPMQ